MESLAANLRASTADPDAFVRFYEIHAPALLRSLTRRVLDLDTALDLTAETMAQAYLGRRRFRGNTDAEARAWLYAIADHKLTSYLRRKKVETRALKRLKLERPRIADEAEALRIERDALAELRQAIGIALARLSQEQREVVELRFVHERSYSQIAAELSISEEAARARLSRATSSLRSLLIQPSLATEAST